MRLCILCMQGFTYTIHINLHCCTSFTDFCSSFLSHPPCLVLSSLFFSFTPSFNSSISTCTSLPPSLPLLSSLSLFLLSCLPHPSLFSSSPPPPPLCLSPSHFLNRSPGGNRHSVHLPVTPPPHHPPLASSLSYVPNSPNQQHPPLHPSLSAVPSTRPGTSLIRVFLPEDQRTTVRFVLAQTEYKE